MSGQKGTSGNWRGAMDKKISLYDMKLLESISLDEKNLETFTRVPGGWIYQKQIRDEADLSLSCCFVPYSDEFKDPPYYEYEAYLKDRRKK